MATLVIMPQLGEAVIEGTISTWLKQPGEAVALYEPLLEIETDKVTTEATAETAGTLLKVLVPAGETVEVGAVLAIIGEPGEDVDTDIEISTTEQTAAAASIDSEGAAANQPAAIQPAAESAQPPSNGPAGVQRGAYSGRVSPVVGRIAGEHNIDLNLVTGSGRDGRITKKDILNFIESREQAVETVGIPTSSPDLATPKGAAATPGEILPLSSIRRAIADHMVRSKKTSPHVTTVFEIDFSAVDNHRMANKQSFARDGAKLTFTAYVIRALVEAVRSHPMVNSSWSEQGIMIHKDINIGMATAIDDGLIVPVIKNADRLSLLAVANAVNDHSLRARSGKLTPDEVQGGTITLTNHGVSGSLFATPIINQPQCAILGTGKIEKRVKVINDAIAIRLMAYASLTFDHRILDGATADSFMSTFAKVIESWN